MPAHVEDSTVWLSKRAARWILTLLCVQFVGLGLVQAWRDSPTYDEAYQLAAGITALTRHQLRIMSAHAPLPGLLAALPALAADPIIPSGPAWRKGDSDTYARRFVAAQARTGKLQTVMFLDRLVPLAEGVAVGLLMYLLARRLFGRAQGVLAAAMWLTLPLALGFSHLDGIDVPFTLTTLVLSLALLRYARGPTTRAAVLVGLAGGLGLVVRLTALALVPVSAVLVLVFGWRHRARAAQHALLVGVTSWAVVWITYRLISPFPHVRHAEPLPPGSVPLLARIARVVPWPSEFRYGIRMAALLADQSQPVYLLGHFWFGVRWWFWPGSMLVKLTLTTIVLVIVGLACWRGIGRRRVREAALVIGVPAAAITAVIVPQRELGLRYLLPVIALAIVAGSPAVRLARRAIAGRVALAVLLFAQLFWFWESAPDSLAWTAPPFRPGYQVAADSNVDWGQDLYRLRDWSRHHPAPVVLYFGTVEPSTVIPRTRSPSSGGNQRHLRAGWWAVSASLVSEWGWLFGLSWLPEYCPVGVVGKTILIYHFEKPPDQRLRGGDEPPSVCSGRFSRKTRGVRAPRA